MVDCVFCKIVSGENKTKLLVQTDNVLAFYDIKPSADTHILIIPKKHIDNFMSITKDNRSIYNEMIEVAQKLIKEKKIDGKYKLVVNGGEYQFVPHLHLHLMGGEIKGNI